VREIFLKVYSAHWHSKICTHSLIFMTHCYGIEYMLSGEVKTTFSVEIAVLKLLVSAYTFQIKLYLQFSQF